MVRSPPRDPPCLDAMDITYRFVIQYQRCVMSGFRLGTALTLTEGRLHIYTTLASTVIKMLGNPDSRLERVKDVHTVTARGPEAETPL